MAGNDLPGRWQERDRFVIVETGFGLGNNFLATWAAWRSDPRRCRRLVFISIEKHPLDRLDLVEVHQDQREDEDAAIVALLVGRLVQAWPVPTPGWHTIDFDEPYLAFEGAGPAPQVTLMLGLGDIATMLPGLLAQVDAFYLDGFSPAQNPEMWAPALLARLDRLAAPGATVATWSVARSVRDALSQAGFAVEKAVGFGGKRDMTCARFEPRHVPRPHAGGLWPVSASRTKHAVVIGGGLAGCAAAWALTREGWQVSLLDRHPYPAGETSGNPGGLFHSVVHGDDGIHARVLRAASLLTHRLASSWMDAGGLNGQCQGLIRLDAGMNAEKARAQLERMALPLSHVQWLSQGQAQALSGLDLPSGGWLFHQAGWLNPAQYAGLLFEAARQTGLLRWLGAIDIHALGRGDHGWQALNEEGQTVAQGNALILANASGVGALLATLPPQHAASAPPLIASRGQVTRLPASLGQTLRAPTWPVAGQGYVLTLADGGVLCGATAQEGDVDAAVREADQRHNWGIAAQWGVVPPLDGLAPLPPGLDGRVGWRANTPDRLPVIGALPLCPDAILRLARPPRLDQVRLIPRQRTDTGGLFVMSGLGSRGITWAALGGKLLAHWVTASPCPVELDLRDALDPARFVCRQHNRPQEAAAMSEQRTSDSA